MYQFVFSLSLSFQFNSFLLFILCLFVFIHLKLGKALDIFPTFFMVPSLGIQRTRHNPLQSDIVGCTNELPHVFIYDMSDLPDEHWNQTYDRLKYVGVGQTNGGFALDWNPNNSNEFVTGTDDGGIYRYDLNAPIVGQMPQSLKSSACPVKFNHRYSNSSERAVNAVSWSHDTSGNIFGSAGDDGLVCLWDKRSSKVVSKFESKTLENDPVGEVRSLSFCPSDPHMFASGDDSGLARVWDSRMQRGSILALCHDECRFNQTSTSFNGKVVSEVNWIPDSPCLLSTTVSFSAVDHVKKNKDVTLSEQCIWDLSCIEEPLLFNHHNPNHAEITDTSISGGKRNLVANVDSDNMLAIWRMADELR